MKRYKGGIVRLNKGPDAIEDFDRDIEDTREEIHNISATIKQLKNENKKNSKRIINIKKWKNDLILERNKGPLDCKHPEEIKTVAIINTMIPGIGYAGKYCSICGTLIVKEEYQKKVGFESWIPDHPFKKNCKHKWATHIEFKEPVLCMGGRWCKICGRIESTNSGW